MTSHGWKITPTENAIHCQRPSRSVIIPIMRGKPTMDWRSGFGALTMKGHTTWMNPVHVEDIVGRVNEV